ncbi:unnamed protein product, partial [Prunus brigantina]
ILSSKTIGCGTRRGKLYYLDLASDSEASLTRWFVTFIDDCTRMTWVSLLKTKGEVSSKFQQFYHMVETQFHTRIQVLRVPLQSDPSHHTQEERIEEVMPAPENSSAPVPHQSSAEDVIQVTSLPETDNINEITDCISEGAEPTYQIPKRTNRGKP